LAASWQTGRVPARTELPHVVIVGGGIAGLAAAFFLRGTGAAVTVLEGSPRLGGKLAASEVAGIAVDAGAEALLARRPEGTDLVRAVGLAGQLAQPGTTTAGIWTRGRLRPLPRRQLMGVPADLDALASSGILSASGLASAREDARRPATTRAGDVSVASYVGARFGAELVDRLVDPLLGGVYAGRSEQLSFEATLPGLAAASRRHASLSAAAAAVLDAAVPDPAVPDPAGPDPAGPDPVGPGPAAPRPVFVTLTGGLATLVPAVAAASGATIRTGAMVRGLARTPAGGWRLTVGSAHAPEQLDADAVVLALPPGPASRLLAGVAGAGAAAAGLGEISTASMAIITLAYPDAAFPAPPQGSGYLVPAVDGHAVKAVTFSTVKWPHLRAGREPVHLVRCSVGRLGEEALLQRDDGELAALAAADLAAATGVRGAPVDTRVSRWGGGLPQYTVGHLDRVARIRASVAAQPGLAVCGASYDGIGIPACIASARAAADQVIAGLAARARTATSSSVLASEPASSSVLASEPASAAQVPGPSSSAEADGP
jgi:protoporphyrinogen/coproporphyrinogen III oxidase